MEPINFTNCSTCLYYKRTNQNFQHVNKIDPRYSDTLCANCVVPVYQDFDRNIMDRDEYLRKLFEKRMEKRSLPFEIWSHIGENLKWYPMNDDATHWRCCILTKFFVGFQDLYVNTASTPPPISLEETEVNNS